MKDFYILASLDTIRRYNLGPLSSYIEETQGFYKGFEDNVFILSFKEDIADTWKDNLHCLYRFNSFDKHDKRKTELVLDLIKEYKPEDYYRIILGT